MHHRAARRNKDFMPRLLLATALATAWAGTAQAQSRFTGLGGLSGWTGSYANGVDATGAVVTGESDDAAWNAHAVVWRNGVASDLGFLPGGTYSWANAISANGSVVVGQGDFAASPGGAQAFRWTAGGGMVGLGFLVGGNYSSANAVSADGSVVVGSSTSVGGSQPFRWTSGGGMVGLGFLPGGSSGIATGVSADGSVVVGQSIVGATVQSFRWTAGGGMVGLGTMAGGSYSWANGVSADGSVVVGAGDSVHSTEEAFRWTTGGGMVGLGFLGGGQVSEAYAVSADGSVVVGSASDAHFTTQAFRWTQAGGMQSITAWLATAGITVPATWSLTQAKAVNQDGSVVVGYGQDSATNGGAAQAWLARVSPQGSGIINPAVFNQSALEAGVRAAQAGTQLSSLTLFGAHHRSLLDSGLARSADGVCAWITTDAVGHNATNSRAEIVEAGVCRDIGSARLGIGIGQAWSRQNWSLGGGAHYSGQYLIAEAADLLDDGLEVSVTGYYGRFDTRLQRNYQNGTAVDSSNGTPDATTFAVRGRLDWKNMMRLGDFSFSPYAAYTWLETKLDAYTETGGGFPVAYDAIRWHNDDIRTGLAASNALTQATDLRLAVEVVHRLQDANHGVSGQVLGLWRFSLPGEKLKQDWARLTVDLDHRLSSKSLITLGANVASSGSDPSWGVTVGYRMAF